MYIRWWWWYLWWIVNGSEGRLILLNIIIFWYIDSLLGWFFVACGFWLGNGHTRSIWSVMIFLPTFIFLFFLFSLVHYVAIFNAECYSHHALQQLYLLPVPVNSVWFCLHTNTHSNEFMLTFASMTKANRLSNKLMARPITSTSMIGAFFHLSSVRWFSIFHLSLSLSHSFPFFPSQ